MEHFLKYRPIPTMWTILSGTNKHNVITMLCRHGTNKGSKQFPYRITWEGDCRRPSVWFKRNLVKRHAWGNEILVGSTSVRYAVLPICRFRPPYATQ